MERSVDQDNSHAENIAETSSNDDLLDQIPVPSLAPEERIISAVACNGGVSYTTVAPSELGAVPEEDEEAATSSTPSTVVSSTLNGYLSGPPESSWRFFKRDSSGFDLCQCPIIGNIFFGDLLPFFFSHSVNDLSRGLFREL